MSAVDADRFVRLSYDLDVLGVAGDCSSVDTLREAAIGEADIPIASTDGDELNSITSGTAEGHV